jgi:hypothetical protein
VANTLFPLADVTATRSRGAGRSAGARTLATHRPVRGTPAVASLGIAGLVGATTAHGAHPDELGSAQRILLLHGLRVAAWALAQLGDGSSSDVVADRVGDSGDASAAVQNGRVLERFVEDLGGRGRVELKRGCDGAVEADGVVFDGSLDDPRCQYRWVEVVVAAAHGNRVPSLPELAILLLFGWGTVLRRVADARPAGYLRDRPGHDRGIGGLTENLALELTPVRVNAVAGGLVDTPLSARILRGRPRRQPGAEDEGERGCVRARGEVPRLADRPGEASPIVEEAARLFEQKGILPSAGRACRRTGGRISLMGVRSVRVPVNWHQLRCSGRTSRVPMDAYLKLRGSFYRPPERLVH